MADDYSQEYLKHRDIAEKENGPLASFLRENANLFVESKKPAKEEVAVPELATEEVAVPEPATEEPSTFKKALDWTTFFVRPLGALQEAAIAPVAHEFKEETIPGRIGESFKVSGQAFAGALFPAGQRPEYERKIIETEFPNIPENLKPAAEVFLGLASDPAILAFPFMSSVRAGLSVRAAEKAEIGPWRRALEEAVSVAPTKDIETERLSGLAKKADTGDENAARELITEIASDDIAEMQLSKTFGDIKKPLFNVAEPETATRFLDIPKRELPKHAININLSRINTGEDVKSLIDGTAKLFKGEIQESRRGIQTNKATEALAETMNMHPADLLLRRKGQAFNAEEALAARQILVSSAEKLSELSRVVLHPNAGDLDKVAFRKQLALHKALQEQVSGLTAEAGRALQQFRITAEPTKLKLAQIKDITESMGDAGEFTEDMARAIADMKTPAQISDFAKNITKATTKDVFFEVWINALLSGPQTHAVNSISNSLVAAWQIPERFLASGISNVLNTGESGVRATEAIGQAYGTIEGFKDGLKAFARTVSAGEPKDIVGKLEMPINAAISGDSLGISGKMGRAVDYIGRGVRIPGTLLSAEDAFFKSIGYRMELHARAFRQASEEGLSGLSAGKRIQEIIKTPPEDIHLAAIDASRYQTFTQPLGEAGRAYQEIVSNIPILKVITPFIRTPTNIFKFFGERSPFAPMAKSFRADIKAGGSRRDLALARMGLGSMVMATAATFATEGKITGGGPADTSLRNLQRITGWQPYSVKIGDKYVSYGRLEPLGTLFGVAADFAEISGELEESEAQEIAAHLSMAIAKNVTSKTFLRGLSEAVNAFDDPVRYGERWWLNFAQTVVPTGVAQITRTGVPGIIEPDPYLRETRTLIDRVKSRIPGYSKELPPRRNIWGDPIVLSGGLGPDIVSPFYTTETKQDQVSEELLRLQSPITMPSKYIQAIELDPKQYDRLIILTGKEPIAEGEQSLKEALAEFMKSPDYQSLTDGPEGGKSYAIRRIVIAYKTAARAKLLEEDNSLRQQVEANRQRSLFVE